MASRFRKLTNAGSGGVTGLSGATGGTAIADNAIIRGDGATGIQGSAVVMQDNGDTNFPIVNDAASPTINFGDGDTGFYETADDELVIATFGTGRWRVSGAGSIQSFSVTTGTAQIDNVVSTATVPVYTFVADSDTGVGRGAANQVCLIAGAEEILRCDTVGALVTAGNGFAMNGATVTASQARFGEDGNGTVLAAQAMNFGSSVVAGWTSGNAAGVSKDIALSRVAANVLGVGTGAGASTAGWIMDAGGKRNTANQTVTDSTTHANSTDLTITVASGRTYQFRCWLPFTTVNTSGAKVAVSGAATHTNIIYDVTFFGISTPGFLTSGRATAKDTAVGVTASGTACYALIEGTTTINAGGAMTIQFAQNAETGAAESVILLRGATFTLTDVA